MAQHVTCLVLTVYDAHSLLGDLVAVRDERIQDVTRFLNVVDGASARMQSGLGFIQRDSLLDLEALETRYPGLVEELWLAFPHHAPSAQQFKSRTQEKTTEALRRASVFADNLEAWVKKHKANCPYERTFDDKLRAEFDDETLRNEANVLRSLLGPLPGLCQEIERFVNKTEQARAIRARLDAKIAKHERKLSELRQELATTTRKRKAAEALLESRERPHESLDTEEKDGSDSKRARTVPFVEKIIVLTGRFGDSDDADPLVKYWDPDLCASPALRDMIAKELRTPEEAHALIAYLLTGEADAGIIADDSTSLAAVSPTDLGVRDFPKTVSIDVKNDCPF
jgi:hypothetical protein